MKYEEKIKKILSELLAEVMEASDEFAVGEIKMKIDLFLVKKVGEGGTKLAKPLVISTRMRKFNVVEIKSSRVRPDARDIIKLVAYTWLAALKEGLEIQDVGLKMTTWYVSVTRPIFTDKWIAEDYLEETGVSGLLQLKAFAPCDAYFLILNDVDLNDDTVELLIGRSGSAFKEVYEYILDHELKFNPIIEQCLKTSILENYSEVKHLVHSDKDRVSFALDGAIMMVRDLGLKEFIDRVGFKPLVDLVGFKPLVDEVGIKALVDEVGIKALVDEVGIDAIIDAIGRERLIKALDLKDDDG